MEDFNAFFESEDTSESREVAASLTNRYLADIFEQGDSVRISRDRDGLPLKDINAHLSNLAEQVSLFRRIGIEDFPAIRLENQQQIPVDIFQYRGGLQPDQRSPFYYDALRYGRYPEEQWYYLMRSLREQPGKTYSALNPGSLRENLGNALNSFISFRHAALFNSRIRERIQSFFRRNPPGNDGDDPARYPPGAGNENPTQYLTVKVITEDHGLSISASPAYFLSFRKFGSPSSPVSGPLLPGTYIFGAQGMSLPDMVIDKMPADIPPNYEITLNL